MKTSLRLLPVAMLAALAGCVTVPSGPSVMVLPGDGRSFDQFRFDDQDCRNYAQSQIGGSAEQAATDSAVRSAVVGTAIGALAGAAIGGNSHGAATGAGAGLLIGSAAGSGAAASSGYSAQRRYDFAFQQCMYAKGHRIAGRGARPVYGYAPGPAYAPPPAPPGYGAPSAPPASGNVPPPGSAPPPR